MWEMEESDVGVFCDGFWGLLSGVGEMKWIRHE